MNVWYKSSTLIIQDIIKFMMKILIHLSYDSLDIRYYSFNKKKLRLLKEIDFILIWYKILISTFDSHQKSRSISVSN